jgi:glycosyltransferase involved in cell wall biosynthesis
MKLSIITPSYQQGAFIKKCIASVKRQKGDFAVEHIVLDNCSTDETKDVLAEYLENPGHVELRVFVEPDSGQTSAINKGFALATGDVLCWLNTDEEYQEGALQKVVSFLNANPLVDVVFGNCDFVDSCGRTVKRKREHFFSQNMLLFYGCFIPSCATFVRRRIIEAGIILDPKFKVNMDFDWYVRISKAGYKFATLPATLARFTWHDTNISTVFVERRLWERRFVQDRDGGVPGPAWFRALVYAFMRRMWQAIRVLRRTIGSRT